MSGPAEPQMELGWSWSFVASLAALVPNPRVNLELERLATRKREVRGPQAPRTIAAYTASVSCDGTVPSTTSSSCRSR